MGAFEDKIFFNEKLLYFDSNFVEVFSYLKGPDGNKSALVKVLGAKPFRAVTGGKHSLN